MRVIITEDIVKKALDESIDEFILEEGWFGNAWNSLKGSQLGQMAGKAGNWLKNAAAMYMDARTNGQWNQKYGIHVNGNTKSGEIFYLTKWLNYYREKLNNIIYQANNPDRRDEYDILERDPNTNKETIKRRRYDYVGVDGAVEYAKTYCTFQNFNDYVKGISPDRENVKLINTYIFNYITKQANKGDLNTVLANLNIGKFFSSNEGQNYLKMNRTDQQSQQQQRRKNTQDAWKARSANQQQTQPQQPTPDKKNGTFTLPTNQYPYNGQDKRYKGWVYSTDKNGNRIVINPNNPKQAAFV